MRKTQILFLFLITLLLAGCNLVPTSTEKTSESNSNQTNTTEGTNTNDNFSTIPQNVIVEGETISWDSINQTTGYLVNLNGNTYQTDTNQFNINSIYIEDGTYKVTVQSLNGTNQSDISTEVSFELNRNDVYDAIFGEILVYFNETYKPDMGENDFENIHIYQDYLSKVTLADGIARTMTSAGIEKEDSIDIFRQLESLPNNTYADFDALKQALDEFSGRGLTPNKLANILIEMIRTQMEFSKLNTQNKIDFYTETVANFDHDSINALKQKLGEYSGGNTLVSLIDELGYDNSYYYDQLSYLSANFASQLIDNEGDTTGLEYYIEFYRDDVTLQDLVSALIVTLNDIYLNDDLAFLNDIRNFSFDVFIEYATDMQYKVALEEKEINQVMMLENFEVIETLLDEEEEPLLDGIETVINYVNNVYSQIDTDLIEQFDDLIRQGSLTVEEAFILKDEIASVFSETLPTVEDFKKIFTLSSILTNVLNEEMDADFTFDETMIDFNAVIAYETSKLWVELIKDINVETYNKVSNLVNEIYTPAYQVYDYRTDQYIWVEEEYNVEKAVELVLYIDSYYREFKVAYMDDFDKLEAVLTDETFKQKMVDTYEAAIILALNENGADEDYIDYVTELFDHISEIEDAVELLTSRGIDVYDYLIETEGQIILDGNELIELLNNDEDPYLLVQHYSSLFTQFVDYHDLIMDLTDEELTLLVDTSLLFMKYPVISESTLTSSEYDDLSEELSSVLTDIIKPWIQFEKSIIIELENRDAVTDAFDHSDTIDFEDSVLEQVVKAADTVLTDSVEAELIGSVEKVFDEILVNPTVMAELGITSDELATQRLDVITHMNDIFDKLELIATFDFDNLTPENEADIEEFYQLIG